MALERVSLGGYSIGSAKLIVGIVEFMDRFVVSIVEHRGFAFVRVHVGMAGSKRVLGL